jgi:hypothetical protein
LRINYKSIKSKCISSTKNLVGQKDWVKIGRIQKQSPQQIIEYLDFEELEDQIVYNPSFIKKYFEFKNNKKVLSFAISIILELIKEERDHFSEHFRIYLAKKLFPECSNLTGREVNLIVESLGPEIVKIYKENIMDYPKIVYYGTKLISENLFSLVPRIIEMGDFKKAYKIVVNNIKAISNYYKDIELLFKNVILNQYQYKKLKELFRNDYPDLLNVVEKNRILLKKGFIKKLKDQSNGNIDHKWFRKNYKIFSFTFTLFSDDELKEITSKLLDLGIPNTFSQEVTNGYLINQCLLVIDFGGKIDLFESFLDRLIKFNYYQIVNDYYRKTNLNRDEEYRFRKWLVKNQFNISEDIAEAYPNKINLKEPVKTFKFLFEKTKNFNLVTKTFYKDFPEHTEEFTKILHRYLDKIDFSVSNDYSFILIDTLLGSNQEYFPKWDIKFFQNKLSASLFFKRISNFKWMLDD